MNNKTNKQPFVKKFEEGGFYYVYDVNTFQIVEVEKPVYDIIDIFDENNSEILENKFKDRYEPSVIRKSIDEIQNARKEYGLFSDFRPSKVTMGIRTAEDVEKLHEFGISQLLLELLTGCNLECSYCHASGKYFTPLTETSPKEMSWDTCKKAVDFFCERIDNSDSHFISFYGGEPLLKFDMIKEIVKYIHERFEKGKFRFNLTSNGTLLNREIIDFFAENSVNMMVSLDGPENVNDRYRLFRNGGGTFSTIMKNLAFLKGVNPKYFKENVSISGVLCPPFDNFDDILEFFSSNPTLHEIKSKIRSSLVDTKNTAFLEDFELEEQMKQYPFVSEKMNERLKNAFLKNSTGDLTIEKRQLVSVFSNLARRPEQKLYNHITPSGTCHMGLRRLFVRTNGDFYVCERVGDRFKIGNIEKGFDYEELAEMYRKFDYILEDCCDCWALSHCERCWAVIGNPDEFKGKKKERFCEGIKRAIGLAFEMYTQILRENPDSLKIFEEKTSI